MSVEAAPPPAQASVPVTAPTPTAAESEIVALLREQNALLLRLVASLAPPPTDPDIALARAISMRIEPTEEAQFVAVDTATAASATGRTTAAAARALGAPPERTLTTRTGGRVTRLPSIRRVPSRSVGGGSMLAVFSRRCR